MNSAVAAMVLLLTSITSCTLNENSRNMMSNDMSISLPSGAKADTATFGNGCFWCTEAIFQQLDGVLKVTSGYSGGHVEKPTYKEVCEGTTGHAEVIQILYDPSVI